VICTDKTGALTENRMEVKEVWTADANDPLRLIARIAAVAAACNSADL
jgi:magnesium-transporting ATPase (P-type)